MEDVVIIGPAFGEARRQLIEPRLVAELVRRSRLGADVIHDSYTVSGRTHGGRIVARPAVSNASVGASFGMLPERGQSGGSRCRFALCKGAATK